MWEDGYTHIGEGKAAKNLNLLDLANVPDTEFIVNNKELYET